MTPVEVLLRLGGVADTRALRRLCSRGQIRSAMARGEIVRDSRGRYSLPSTSKGRRAAHRLTAVASHLTAAALHGWETKQPPPMPMVTVPRNRRVSPERREGVDVRWADLRADEVVRGAVTSAGRTVMDCAKDLPFDEGLAVADSALRHRALTKGRLLDLAEAMPQRHRPRCLRVAEEADGRAANPFESVLRATALDVPGLTPEPQVVISGPGFSVRPDLVDRDRKVVAEADSFGWHGSRSALKADCRRYNTLALRGWLVLRFSWEDVMFAPDYVRECLEVAAARPQEHALESSRSDVSA